MKKIHQPQIKYIGDCACRETKPMQNLVSLQPYYRPYIDSWQSGATHQTTRFLAFASAINGQGCYSR